nr:hypothetical protein [Tanacetum cinerariifolium]
MWFSRKKEESGFEGTSSGIGAETARVLALHGVHVVMAIRNTETGTKVKERIVKETPNAKIEVMKLDLSSFASVRKLAIEYCSSGLPLNILINNAGVMAPPFTLSEDNIELQFATNHLVKEGRIVNVSSMGHRFAKEGINFDKITNKSSYGPIEAYG